jgi:regulator of protease activity HflC (stomatin/prohibitin superfamily)
MRQGRTLLSRGFDVFVIVLVLLVVVTIAMGVRTIPQGYAYTVERFGRYSRTLTPGSGSSCRMSSAIGHKVNVMEQVLDVPSQEAFTRDNAGVTIDAAAFYQVIDAGARVLRGLGPPTGAAHADHDQHPHGGGLHGSRPAPLPPRRDQRAAPAVMDAAASPWGVKVTRIEIKDILPPADLAGAMARQMKAEREKRAAVLEAEGLRQAEILRAEGQKQSQILAAEGRKEAAFRDAEAASARRRPRPRPPPW